MTRLIWGNAEALGEGFTSLKLDKGFQRRVRERAGAAARGRWVVVQVSEGRSLEPDPSVAWPWAWIEAPESPHKLRKIKGRKDLCSSPRWTPRQTSPRHFSLEETCVAGQNLRCLTESSTSQRHGSWAVFSGSSGRAWEQLRDGMRFRNRGQFRKWAV